MTSALYSRKVDEGAQRASECFMDKEANNLVIMEHNLELAEDCLEVYGLDLSVLFRHEATSKLAYLRAKDIKNKIFVFSLKVNNTAADSFTVTTGWE